MTYVPDQFIFLKALRDHPSLLVSGAANGALKALEQQREIIVNLAGRLAIAEGLLKNNDEQRLRALELAESEPR